MSPMSDNKEKEFVNPIDEDKVTDNPSGLEYAHTVGSAVVKPIDKGKVKGRAVSAMVDQTNRQLQQIHEQISTLAKQAKNIKQRAEISEKIYLSEMNFEPLIGHTYYLYQKENLRFVLSMLSPEEWGRSLKYEFVAEVHLLSDHTWEIKRSNKDFFETDEEI